MTTARRLLLAGQGLLRDPSAPATPRRLYELIEQMGFVQIDTINVVERAHHLTLATRMHSYRHAMFDALLGGERQLFEQWTHDASAIPTKWFPHWRHRFERARKRIRANTWWRQRVGSRPQRIVDEVMRRIERDGPLQSRDFEASPGARSKAADSDAAQGWWNWKPQKAALEYLWRTGELTVARRVNFQKVYDLTSRVLPEHHAAPASAHDEHLEWACATAIERLGVANAAEIAAFWRAVDLVTARRWCERAAREGRIVPVLVESAAMDKPRPAYARPDWEAAAKKASASLETIEGAGIRLLSPFDPVVRDRKRAQRLFGFDYTFEAFVPASKRRHGYYVLPMLEGERFVGRIDPQFDRGRGVLEIRGVWWEPGIKLTRARKAAFAQAADRLAKYLGASTWRVSV